VKNRDTTVTIGWTWEPEEEWAYDFRITATCSPYVPATYDYPGEGPTCEITAVKLDHVYGPAGRSRNWPAIEAAFSRQIETNAALRKQIEERCYEAA
jgi:hypothetical protein